MIVTLEQVRNHLRYDTDDNDEMLQMYLEAAEDAVLNYITDTFKPNEYPPAIKHAVLLMVGVFDSYRNAESETPIKDNYLPPPVQALLFKYRTLVAL